MAISDTVDYLVFSNPISSGIIKFAKTTSNAVLPNLGLDFKREAGQTVKIITERTPLDEMASKSGPLVKIAGVCGATAVILGAYGAHRLNSSSKEEDKESKTIFDTANKYHFIHSLALLSTPLCHSPKTSATFLTAGIILFSGSLYYRAFTGDTKFSRITPVGGTCFIIGWLAMII